MTHVSLSSAEKTIDAIWLWYQRATTAMRSRLFDEKIGATATVNPVFFGMAPEEVGRFFAELDFLSILDLLFATEAALRVDFWIRVHNKDKDDLSRNFRELVKAHEERISLEQHVLEAWVIFLPDLKSRASEFKSARKLRHWLAHGRYWTPKFGRMSYSPADVFDICQRLLSKAGLT